MSKESKLENMTIDQLKSEYVNLTLGALLFDAKTKNRRNEISREIERRESMK